jgi:acetoin utilization protein AcuA
MRRGAIAERGHAAAEKLARSCYHYIVIEKRVKTKRGEVILARDFSEEYIRCLGMGEGLGVFFHYRYQDAHKTRKILSSVSESGDTELACVVFANCIVGYVLIVSPEPDSRWSEINNALLGGFPALADPVLLELGSIEMSTPWRGLGLSRELLRFIFEEPVFEEKIVISRELSWTWDLRSTGLTPLAYRSKLLRLFESAGFRYCDTDENEIGYAGENMLTVRFGERIPPEAVFLFHRMLSKREQRGWGWG